MIAGFIIYLSAFSSAQIIESFCFSIIAENTPTVGRE